MNTTTVGAPTRELSIGLLGNPNTGKSSLFNRLTGLRQKVGNYPGVTVEKKEGVLRDAQLVARLVDMPGAYSLAAGAPDEKVVVDALCNNLQGIAPFDLIVCVVDSTNLLRNLFLVAQVADLNLPIVIALNLADEAARQGIKIDHQLLSQRLGVPCVPTDAKSGAGVKDLKKAIFEAAVSKPRMKGLEWPPAVKEAVDDLRAAVPEKSALSDSQLRRLLFDVDSVLLEQTGLPAEQQKGVLDEARRRLFRAGLNPLAAEALLHYANLRKLLEGVVQTPEQQRTARSETIDRLLIHRGWGLAIFVGMMYLVFQAVYSWANPFMSLIEGAIGLAQDLTGPLLEQWPVLQSLVTDGVIGGVGAFLVFLPQILILFFFISFLEDSGYMARAAFLMDKLFSWCGLNGKSFVPLLSSYACAIPGIMATRTITDPKARLTTILVAPLMSCSARLPVYVLLIGVFIEPAYGSFVAGLVLFGMHFVGLVISGPVAWLINRVILKTPPQPFVLELPPYRAPLLRDVLRRMWDRGLDFVKTAGTVIFAMTIIIWALLYFPRPESIQEQVFQDITTSTVAQTGMSEQEVIQLLEDEESSLHLGYINALEGAYIEQSYLGRFGKFVQPVFAPAGFDWKITVGIVSSFPAREVIISTLGIIYRLGGNVTEESDELRDRMRSDVWADGEHVGEQVYTIPVVVALMVFFALCQQCASTLVIIGREAGVKWSFFSFFYMTSLAWLAAVIVYQIGSRIT